MKQTAADRLCVRRLCAFSTAWTLVMLTLAVTGTLS
jgi:hypothetical protein